MTPLAKLIGITALLASGIDFDIGPAAPERDYGRTCLALVGFSEARDQDDAGLAMVMRVVINRATDPLERWPRTLCDVALQPGQFLGLDTWPTPRNPERIDAASWQRALNMADHVIAGDVDLPTSCSHATSFDQAPVRSMHAVCRIGAHTFYAEPLTAAVH